MTDIVERLREVAALKVGTVRQPEWMKPNDWGPAVSGLCGDAADEIERLRREWISLHGVERMRFAAVQVMTEEIGRLQEQVKLAVWSDSEECKMLEAEIEGLRAALRACIKSAEADDPLKESGWWDEQSIVAIEQARKILNGY